MSARPPLNVVLLWHMHQPSYRNPHDKQYHLPWTYLHAIKDYVDMAAHLEAVPQARAVVNVVPTLLEQIDDYARQITNYLQFGTMIHDPLLDALIQPVLPCETEARSALVKQCLRANEERLINRFPQYQLLARLAKTALVHPGAIMYLDEQFIADLLVWFHLAWMGETVRRSDPRIKQLVDKGKCYSVHDRNELMRVIGEVINSILPRYRALSASGQVELSITPYAHPIMPLLLDFESTHEAMPEAPLPQARVYPGGVERVNWHLNKAIAVFKQYFGTAPAGCWPSEGSLSEASLKLLAQHHFRWTASGESVLRNSLQASNPAWQQTTECIHVPYHLQALPVACFFRDDGLSDQIGFTYTKWHADDAVANLVHNLENIASACAHDPDAIVSIILDGENAWEYYPENGYYFLSALYKTLTTHPALRLTTYSGYLARQPHYHQLHSLVAGSWVYGTFSTWIGSHDKNQGWQMLIDAKHAYDHYLQHNNVSPEKLEELNRQLAICEGSDWFWWFGDYNPAESVRDFDHLYRLQLSQLYTLLGVSPPEYLSRAFTHGSGSPVMGGVMRRGQEAI